MKKAFVLSFEQLPACMLGCYGHQWIETPNFDQLASISVLFDQHFSNDLCTSQNSFPWWTGQTIPEALDPTAQSRDSFILEMKKQSIHSTLLLESDSESGRNASDRAQESFFNVFDQVESVSGLNGFHVKDDETPIAKLMQTAIKKLPEWMGDNKDQIIWIRSAGIPLEPLAPEFFSTLYLDEVLDQGDLEDDVANATELIKDDKSTLDADAVFSEVDESEGHEEEDLLAEDWQELITAVSELFLNSEEWSELDDQERLMARAVYAGYVTLLDQWFGRFLDQLLEHVREHEILLILTAARGGNELLGPVRNSENWGLFDEISHVPLFIYDSKNQHQGNRQQFLSQSADIPSTLLNWWGIHSANSSRSGNNLLAVMSHTDAQLEPMIFTASEQAFALRTAKFYYLEQRNQQEETNSEEIESLNEEQPAQLYQKPTDRWDIYDIHSQLPEIVTEYSNLLAEKRTKQHDQNLS